MRVWIQQGTVWNLEPKTAEGFRQVVKHASEDIYVTSGAEGDHRPDSFHYTFRAWDMRKCGYTKARLKKVVGPNYDVVEYSWGFHVERERG